MARAVGRLLVRSALIAAVALVLAALLALVIGGTFSARFRLIVLLLGALLLLLAATGSSPAMDRAIGQHGRSIVGPLLGHQDETYEGPRASTAAVFVLAALVLIAVGAAVDVS